jgi:hypothetical protein
MQFRCALIFAASLALFKPACSVCQPTAAALPKDPMALIRLAREKNGLNGDDIKPWHMRGTYHRYKFGQLYYKGVYEEWWFSPTLYKLSFISSKFSQTDYATRGALLRSGAQEWLSGPELLLQTSLLEPLPEAAQLGDFKLHRDTRKVSKSKLDCVTFRYKTRTGPQWEDDLVPSACVEPSTTMLRGFSQGRDQMEIRYDQIAAFQERYIAHQIQVFSGRDHQLVADLQLDLVEALKQSAETIVTPPPSAAPVDISRVVATNSGISFWPLSLIVAEPTIPPPSGLSERISVDSPQHPDAREIRGNITPDLETKPNVAKSEGRGRVVIKVSIGPDGHVKDASVVSGPPSFYQQSLEAAREWVFRPFIVMGQPRAVETLLSF